MVQKATSSSEQEHQNDLQMQIEQLRKDIKQITASFSHMGSEKLNQAKGKAEAIYASAKSSGKDNIQNAKEKIDNLEEQITDQVKQHPLSSLAIAAGIGFALALLTKR